MGNRSFQGFQKGQFGNVFDRIFDPKLRPNWPNPWLAHCRKSVIPRVSEGPVAILHKFVMQNVIMLKTSVEDC